MPNIARAARFSVLPALLLTSLAACSGSVQAPDANPRPHDSPSGTGLFSGTSGNMLDAFSGNSDSGGILGLGESGGGSAALGVNAFLWRAALETISVLPLQSADSAGGVIITDWKIRPDNLNERVKATVYLFGKQLSAQSVKVELYKQTRKTDANGAMWVDAPVEAGTARQLENAILTKAKALQVAAQQAK